MIGILTPVSAFVVHRLGYHYSPIPIIHSRHAGFEDVQCDWCRRNCPPRGGHHQVIAIWVSATVCKRPNNPVYSTGIAIIGKFRTLRSRISHASPWYRKHHPIDQSSTVIAISLSEFRSRNSPHNNYIAHIPIMTQAAWLGGEGEIQNQEGSSYALLREISYRPYQ